MIGLASFGQDATPSDKAPTSTKTPPKWHGHWTGMALSLDAQGLEMKFRIDLMVGPKEGTDQLTWTLVYDGDPGKSECPYLLATINAARGRFAIDEQNGIVLDATLIGNAHSTHFCCGFFVWREDCKVKEGVCKRLQYQQPIVPVGRVQE